MTKININLGDRVEDKITGFSGIAHAITTWLNGCIRVAVQPETLHEGKPIEDRYFDITQLTLVEAHVHTPITVTVEGGPPRESSNFSQ